MKECLGLVAVRDCDFLVLSDGTGRQQQQGGGGGMLGRQAGQKYDTSSLQIQFRPIVLAELV